jgi:hypothetical protein
LDGNMPGHGPLVLSELTAHYVTLVREPRGRQGRLNVARLLDKNGDAKVTDHVAALANCDKARAFSLYDRCKPATASAHEMAAPRSENDAANGSTQRDQQRASG